MRVLGIDLGIKRTGLALSDELGLSVRLLPNLEAKNLESALEKIVSLCLKFNIDVVLLGEPEVLTDKSRAVAKRVQTLKIGLLQTFAQIKPNTKIILHDEFLSSKKALRRLIDLGIPQKKRKKLLDAESARLMVEEYLSAI